MAEKDGKRSRVMVNRASVLTLWAAVVAEVLGFEHDEALTLGRAVAGLNAYSKGVYLGLFQSTPSEGKAWRKRPPPCTRNSGPRSPLAKRDGGPPASWT
jgi:hypothetical protein